MEKDTAIIIFENMKDKTHYDLEIPLHITADDLVVAMDKAFQLGMDTDNMKGYLKSERPIALIRGKRTLEEFGVRNGTVIYFTN